ncbi:2-succinyl-5-enolpyruvyl-6-hydroxy-3-cyclohexene-1-carboxylic-acid synthase [Limosilactobacillus fermentum]|uniref:2-succinyl-5-enolpyruvyl-6-hydroxy-3- cyclohexene-1-carboxylic-acid synthase n=1 Tax=Limosilactobacillus fermentum TaxID=1613 RepID=UPI003B67CF51
MNNQQKASQQALTMTVDTLLTALIKNGVKRVVLSPGSRSTPVAILLGKLQDMGEISLYVDVDERSAAFFGLGLAKAASEPVLLVCTSGTAAANYYPAICEASISNVPLIVLTTDRPPELQAIGAPQTINQTELYGHQVKQFFEFPVPAAANFQENRLYVAYLAQKAVQVAISHPQGPVHLNLPLRKPLMPGDQLDRTAATPPIETVSLKPVLDQKIRQDLTRRLANKHGLIIAGPVNDGRKNAAAITEFAHRLHWPVIADPLSGLRGATNALTVGNWVFNVLSTLPADLQPEIIIKTGATLVSAATTNWLKTKSAPVIELDADHGWTDASLSSTMVIPASAAAILPTLSPVPTSQNWLQKWQHLDEAVRRVIQKKLGSQPLMEPQVAMTIGRVLRPDSTLFVSNSMPIREIDAYFSPTQAGIQVMGNRGANGIDGINSTALGVCAQRGAGYLYTGDLAFFHDLTGLMMARQAHLNLTVIVQNNNGGGIFSLLPQAQEKHQFEKVFGTPLDLNIQAIAMLYGARYQRITTVSALEQALIKPPIDLTVIEIPTTRTTLARNTAKMAQQVNKQIQEVINENYPD